MSTHALVVVRFGSTQVHFRRHGGAEPVLVGADLLDMLVSAEAVKPRAHFHTGSYFLRFIFQAGYGEKPISPKMTDVLPIYEALSLDDGILGDWEYAYEFASNPSGEWEISMVEDCYGECWEDLSDRATRFTSPDAFRNYLDERMSRR